MAHRGSSSMLIASAALASALGACHKAEKIEARNATVAEVREKVAASGIKPKPGRWEAAMTIDRLDIPNVPPEARRMLDARLKAVHTTVSCLTPEKAAKPDASFFQNSVKGCTYDRFSMVDGKISAQVSCARGPQHQTMTMDGAYAPDSYRMAVTTKGEAQPGMAVTMEMTVSAKRVGACKGDEPGAGPIAAGTGAARQVS